MFGCSYILQVGVIIVINMLPHYITQKHAHMLYLLLAELCQIKLQQCDLFCVHVRMQIWTHWMEFSSILWCKTMNMNNFNEYLHARRGETSSNKQVEYLHVKVIYVCLS